MSVKLSYSPNIGGESGLQFCASRCSSAESCRPARSPSSSEDDSETSRNSAPAYTPEASSISGSTNGSLRQLQLNLSKSIVLDPRERPAALSENIRFTQVSKLSQNEGEQTRQESPQAAEKAEESPRATERAKESPQATERAEESPRAAAKPVESPHVLSSSVTHAHRSYSYYPQIPELSAPNNLQNLHCPPSREDSACELHPDVQSGVAGASREQQHPRRLTHIVHVRNYPGLILQPDSTPITVPQLQAEIKGIYHGVLMVETRCIEIIAQVSDPASRLSHDQWKALIALHRTLLYEHSDFFMATQHPSATPMLQGLALKYSMPARMWKHGIHAFLEVLRHRRPDSQEYMLEFIYLAYQMLASLLETVPIFNVTWRECLGDLSRYRMAVEEDKVVHSHWASVAAEWYADVADRCPYIGRLNHHQGILERPSLRKLAYYAKSLNCVLPFVNARDSVKTFCSPIIQDEKTIARSIKSPEASVVTVHAIFFMEVPYEDIRNLMNSAIQMLVDLPTSKLRELGVSLAVTNISAMFGLGDPTNWLWQTYSIIYRHVAQQAILPVTGQQLNKRIAPAEPDVIRAEISRVKTSDLGLQKVFAYDCFNAMCHSYDSEKTLGDVMSFMHVNLVYFFSLEIMQSKVSGLEAENMVRASLSSRMLAWGGFAQFLNSIVRIYGISDRAISSAENKEFPRPGDKGSNFGKPLSEDYFLRGLIWTQWYYPATLFDDTINDDERDMDPDQAMARERAQRVLYLGLLFAYHTDYLEYNTFRLRFSTKIPDVENCIRSWTAPIAEDRVESQLSNAPIENPHANFGDGYIHVESPQKELKRESPKSNPRKFRQAKKSPSKMGVKKTSPVRPRKRKSNNSIIVVTGDLWGD